VKGKGREGERKEGIGEGPAPKYFGPEPHLSWWEIAERWAKVTQMNRIFAARIRAVITNGNTAWARTQGPRIFFSF